MESLVRADLADEGEAEVLYSFAAAGMKRLGINSVVNDDRWSWKLTEKCGSALEAVSTDEDDPGSCGEETPEFAAPISARKRNMHIEDDLRLRQPV
jgi:hypothetical protein